MSAKKGSKSRRVVFELPGNLGCCFGRWHWLLLPSEGFWLFGQHLWLCLRHQFFLNTTPPLHTKQAFVLFNDLVSQKWELGPISPEVPLEEGCTPPPQQLPRGHGCATGAEIMIKKAEVLAHEMLWQSTALCRCVELQCCAGQNSSEEDEDHITKELICSARPKDHPFDTFLKEVCEVPIALGRNININTWAFLLGFGCFSSVKGWIEPEDPESSC